MNINALSKILLAARAYAEGQVSLFEVAYALEEPPSHLEHLFELNGITAPNHELRDNVTPQDIINTILLYYTMSKVRDFYETVYTERDAQGNLARDYTVAPKDGRRQPARLYDIMNRTTKQWRQVSASSAQEACNKAGWLIGNCYVRPVRLRAEAGGHPPKPLDQNPTRAETEAPSVKNPRQTT